MDLDLDFNHLYHKRSEPQYRSKPVAKKQKKVVKRRKKKKVSKKWDNSRTNLKSYKLSPSKQLEKKLSSVSKHRYYAKDLVEEQKRKHFQQRRLKQEEEEIELEQRQLIRRKQLLLRKHPMPNLKRTFPVFTAGRNDYDDTESDDDDEETTPFNDESDESDHDNYNDDDDDDDDDDEENINMDTNKAEMTLQALSDKLSSLENELETMKLNKDDDDVDNIDNIEKNEMNENDVNIINDTNNANNTSNIILNFESINNTLNAAKEAAAASKNKDKKSTKTLHFKLPSMPNISQPPQLTESSNQSTSKTEEHEDKTINKALNSLDVPSLLMLLDKLKIYFKEIQIEKKQNEEFRSTLLESVNAQNTQILHLLSQLASQQKEMDSLKHQVSSLTDKLNQHSNINGIKHKNSEPKWSKHIPTATNIRMNKMNIMNDEIALKDIKNIIQESRPNTYHQTQIMLNNTDWKSISNELTAKNDTFEYNSIPQQPYTVQKHQPQKRSFLPSEPIPAAPPKPVPKHKKNIQCNNNSNYSVTNYPKIRVERFHK